MEPDVQQSFAKQHRAGYEYFVSTDAPRPDAAARAAPGLRVSPIKAWSVDAAPAIMDYEDARVPNMGKPSGGHSGCPPNTVGHRFLLPMAKRLASCFTSMEEVEAAELMAYAYVFRLRPDHILLSPLPHVSSLVGNAGVVHLWDDQFGLAHRSDADTLLLAPSVVYASCAGLAEWTIACRVDDGFGNDVGEQIDAATMARCHEQSILPCETAMALITAYGRAHRWARLPLQSLNWYNSEDGRPPPSNVEDTGAAAAGDRGGDAGTQAGQPVYFCLRRGFGRMEALADRRKECVDSKGSDNICMSC